MTYLTPRRALPALTFASLCISACDPSPVCPCPFGGAIVAVPATQSIPLESVTTDPPCSASGVSSDQIFVMRQNTGTCQVRAQLTNGETYTFSVQFRASGSGCCGHVAFAVDSSVPELVDAGAP